MFTLVYKEWLVPLSFSRWHLTSIFIIRVPWGHQIETYLVNSLADFCTPAECAAWAVATSRCSFLCLYRAGANFCMAVWWTGWRIDLGKMWPSKNSYVLVLLVQVTVQLLMLPEFKVWNHGSPLPFCPSLTSSWLPAELLLPPLPPSSTASSTTWAA